MEEVVRLMIRKGIPQDADDLAEIEKACFSVPWSRESLYRDLSGNALSRYVVAQVDDEIVGYINAWLIREEAHINNVAVLPKERRQHIGSLMMEAFLHVTEVEGAQSHTLEVRTSNEPAIKMYEKFGFRSVGTRPGYYQDNGEDALIMWRIGDPNRAEKES